MSDPLDPLRQLILAAGAWRERVVTGDATQLPFDDLVIINGANPVTYTLLPAVIGIAGHELVIKCLGKGGGVTIQCSPTDLIDGQASLALGQGQFARLVNRGANGFARVG